MSEVVLQSIDKRALALRDKGAKELRVRRERKREETADGGRKNWEWKGREWKKIVMRNRGAYKRQY